MKNNYDRFSVKVQDYIKYRPDYPEEMVTTLITKLNLDARKIVSDIGSGTGISSKPFLDHNFKVYAVEPNGEMRYAAEQIFGGNKNFISINGTSEDTHLESKSVDLIFCGQAFHWFDLEKTKIEFDGILKTNGNIVLAWNERDTDSPLQNEYEKILNSNIDEYKLVNHKNINKEIIYDFFNPKTVHEIELNNSQKFDLQGLKGRASSSSYTPESGKIHDKIMTELERLFEKYETNGYVQFDYKTKIYYC